ncbi:uncharacterized protein F5147DRAFT_781787 [Suillus discolor]|uniref:DUF6830 domain-containing protein n=1 Tax=Suillus discolor TaxID=1912936 RepID=A0A9P7ESM6_9AGAM|nr:uncharacterized protein F5147DRAFT_781787 [Suillus discolor]KAG2086081.1 hypothetical protein F5147DRAFT_781787 [Suillus discolor]
MSQPRSGCNNWLEDLIQLNSTLPLTEDPMAVDNIGEVPSYEQEEYTSFGEDLDFEQESGGGPRDKDSEVVTDYFPQPPLAFEEGYTSLEMINDLPLSFHSAKELRGRAESLPSGPRWKSRVIPTLHPTKSPAVLYWRDPLECIATIFNHPLFHNRIDYTACKVYSTAERLSRIYTEWVTGEHAWQMQSALPHGATLLGTILSSDKTCITSLSGDRVAHPLLISLANIHMDTRLKSSSNAFLLTALLPVVKFVHKNKRMREIMRSRARPNDVKAFFREAQKFRLNGIDKPFWSDWLLADPSQFFTPESLHHVHQEFWDHDAQWIILGVGGSKIDFQFSITQPTTGHRHFHEVSADAVPAAVVVAIRALMHFRYLVQSLYIDDKHLAHITATLDEFHANKHAVIAAGLCQGKGGKVIDNWQILKLELMQNIVPSIRNSGVIAQWSADVTEHAHITEVKDPARSSNNNNYDSQICRYLDRADKCNWFYLATSRLDRSWSEDLGVFGDEFIKEDDEIDDDVNDFPAQLLSQTRRPRQPCPITNYFSMAKILQHKEIGLVLLPLCSFIVGHTALNLSYHPSIRNATIDEVTIMFSLPDLRPAIADFLHHEKTYGNHIHSIGGPRRATHDAELPFDNLQVWFKILTHGLWVVMIRSLSRPTQGTLGLPAAFQGTPLAKLGLSFGPLVEVEHHGHGTISS